MTAMVFRRENLKLNPHEWKTDFLMESRPAILTEFSSCAHAPVDRQLVISTSKKNKANPALSGMRRTHEVQ